MMLENVLQQTVFENYINLFFSSSFGKTILLDYENMYNFVF